MPAIEVHSLCGERLADFLHFFDHVAFAENDEWRGCYCHFHYHDPGNGAWRRRPAQTNRQAMVALIGQGRAEGLLAYEGDRVVGWCNAAPLERFPVLRRLPGDPEGAAFVPCFLIARGRRRQGIARQLLRAACEAFERRGYERILGKPMRSVKTPADSAFGPLAVFIEAGFSVLFEDERGNVYVQKELQPDTPQWRPAPEAPEPPW